MTDYKIQRANNCPLCNQKQLAPSSILRETENFYIVCDANPITEGHILIIPKKHIPCVGEFDDAQFKEFQILDKQVSVFIIETYGNVASFEHGVFGQTVFHSHVHYLPFKGDLNDIVPEKDKISEIKSIEELKKIYGNDGGYLYISIEGKEYVINVSIAEPRFFRNRIANALGKPERGNWKEMINNPQIKTDAENEIKQLKEKWIKLNDYN